MTRKVELHAAADRDLDRLAEFLLQMTGRAARDRSRKIRERLRALAETPFIGRHGPEPSMRELVMRFGKSAYVARYRVTDDAITVLRIWHGLEDRPK